MFSISIILITNGHIVGTPTLATVTIIYTTSKIIPGDIYVCITVRLYAATYVKYSEIHMYIPMYCTI